MDQEPCENRKRGRFKSFFLALGSFVEFALGSVHCWWIFGLFSAALLAWAGRYSLNADGLSYVDLASEASRGGPSQLVNGLWSPGYPALISIVFFLFRPSPSHEIPLVHVVNFLLFSFTLWTFTVFFRSWHEHLCGGTAENENRNGYVTALAFCTFLWFTLRFIGTEYVTPDLGVAGIVFLAAGISYRLVLPGSTWKRYAALGLVVGMGYYFKAIMLPLGVALLVILSITLPLSNGVAWRKLLLSLSLSLSVLLVVTAPLVAALSIQAKKLSFGDAGHLNYVWHVNKVPWPDATGGRELNTTLKHPARKLLTTPLTLEFASPIAGTYPLWYDPSYWYAGAKAKFDMHQQIAELKESLAAYQYILFLAMPFLAAETALYISSLHEKPSVAPPRIAWWQLAWALVACSLCAIVHTEARYVSPFLVLFCLAVYRALIFRVNRQVAIAVCSAVLFAVMVPFTFYMATLSAGFIRDLGHPRMSDDQVAALGLRDLGLKPGDRLAIVGRAYDCYYARYDRLRVVAQIPNAQEFWRLNVSDLKSLSERLASIGVKALVVSDRPERSPLGDWRDIKVSDSARLSVLLLSSETTQSHTAASVPYTDR